MQAQSQTKSSPILIQDETPLVPMGPSNCLQSSVLIGRIVLVILIIYPPGYHRVWYVCELCCTDTNSYLQIYIHEYLLELLTELTKTYSNFLILILLFADYEYLFNLN